MAMKALDIADYVTVPGVNVKRGIALGISVVTAIPRGGSAPVKDTGLRVRTSTVGLLQAWGVRQGRKSAGVHEADSRHDQAWGALRDGLKSAMALNKNPQRQQAAITVYDKLFSNGFAFLNYPFKEQWAESERLLQLIESAELEPAIDLACGGPDHMEELREAHEEYGVALNITEARDAEAEVNLRDELAQLRAAIADYALQVVAWSNQAAANVVPAAAALRPIDEQRAADARRSSGADEPDPDVSPETRVPPVPAT